MLQFNENRERSEKRRTETAISSDDCLRQVEQSIKERAIQCDTMHLRTGLIFTWNIFYMFCVQWTAPWSGQGKQTDPSHGPDKPDNVQHTLRWFRKCTLTSTPFTTMFTEISVQYDKYLDISYCTTHSDTSYAHLLCAWGQASALKCPQEVQKANLKLEDYQLGNNYQKQTSNIDNHPTITWWHLVTHYGLLRTCCLVLLANA